jgi:hypothetical protein
MDRHAFTGPVLNNGDRLTQERGDLLPASQLLWFSQFLVVFVRVLGRKGSSVHAPN